ncbi:hypothetical protein C0992_002806 [Termitomyces sp. T32_za158]|nr:hypothetical protein C0992_002806 [Termitomyces sp. T32_za158]
MYGSLEAPPSRRNLKTSTSKIECLLAENSSDDEDFRYGNDSFDELEPWQHEFDQYLNSVDVVPEGMSSVCWWGINSQQLPVWASLACNHLPILASSVSSERAFSAAGITISKCRNRLHGDIVEALQFLKCAIHSDLLFREPPPSSLVEAELEAIDNAGDRDWEDIIESEPWDILINVDDSDNNS